MASERWVVRMGLSEEQRSSRLAFLQIGDEERRCLAELHDVLSPHMEAVVGEWHSYLLDRAETRDLLNRGRVREHLLVVQARYFRALLTGPYDEPYFEDRLRIGFIHERVGLDPAWYMGSYRKYQDLVRAFLLREGHRPPELPRWLAALERVIYLDMELALDAYFYEKNREVIEANEALGRTTRRLRERNVQLTHQFERAQEAARVKEQFLSKVSHELRTPLNAVVGFADLMADGIDGPVTDEQARSLTKIRRQGERLLEMVDQMIDAAKMAAAGLSDPRPFALAPLVEELAEEASRSAQAKGLAFEACIPTELPTALGDPEGFALAVRHLLENAVKFTERGSIVLEAEPLGGAIRFTVRDTGPGIPAEHRERVFEPFHQVETGDTRRVSGLGMGLTLARQGLERMGGILELVATGPGGSSFAVEIPTGVLTGSTAEPMGRP